MSKKNKTFMVYAKVRVDTGLPITAESMEDALEKARQLKIDSFVDIHGEHNDSEVEITGVWA